MTSIRKLNIDFETFEFSYFITQLIGLIYQLIFQAYSLVNFYPNQNKKKREGVGKSRFHLK